MKKKFFKFLAQINKRILPSFSKKGLDLSRATKWQMAVIGWRYYVTINALD
ncbi:MULTISPECIES: SsrA-binding protein [Arenibacter]|uniref:SsrA-binding protein n=1 Tax=Arenibacter TaxID=178469 RepID=UPI000A39142E|nr:MULTISPECIES: SsrA-binding protein [Arenibacter]